MARSAVRFCEVDRQIEIAGWPAEIACPTGLRRSQLPEWTGGSAAEALVPQAYSSIMERWASSPKTGSG